MKIIVFGIQNTSEVISYYLQKWQIGSICAYTVDSAYCKEQTFLGKPVIPTEYIADHFKPGDYSAFVAVGYSHQNRVRSEKADFMKSIGYKLINVINPEIPPSPYFCHGDNCFVIPDDMLIVPGAAIGSNVYIWNKCSIGHDVYIGDNSWISTGTIIGGDTSIGQNCFVGMGATITNGITIGDNCLVGIGATVKKSVKNNSTVISQAAKIIDNNDGIFSAFIK